MGVARWIRGLVKRPTTVAGPETNVTGLERNIKDKEDYKISGSPAAYFTRVAGQACDLCKKINPNKKDVIIHFKYSDLVVSAARGCPVCLFFKENCSRNSDSRTAEIYVNQSESELYYRQPTTGGGVRKSFQVFLSSASINPGTSSLPWRGIDQDPLAGRSLAILQSWLATCFETHLGCKQAVAFRPPTRLIYISGGALRLCELDTSFAIHIKYTALSHCWGERQVFHTTTMSMAAYKSKIAMEELPRAFQDAVTMTRKLGLQYLWIDSICIVQDSEDDWARECLRMGDYYRNAYITLSALEAPDSDESFLGPRELPSIVQLPSFPDLYIRPKRPERRQIFRSAALNSRGWSFQERLLSTRVLHFTHFEMFWECCTCSAEETSTIYYHQNAVDFRSLGPSDGEDLKRALSSLDKDQFSEINGAFLLWQRLVRQFSRRSLTYISDRLPAVSGLAAVVETNTGSRYLAGIWEHDLSSLAWFRDSRTYLIDHSKSRSRVGDYLAPSWSWASMRTSIIYRFDDGEIIRSSKDPVFVESNLDISSLNPFGNVTGGYFVISALVISVRYFFDTVYMANGNHMVGVAYMDDDSFSGPGPEIQVRAVRISERGSSKSKRADFYRDRVVHFLLVVPGDTENLTWRRVGAGVSRDLSSSYLHQEDLPDLFKEDDRTLLRLV